MNNVLKTALVFAASILLVGCASNETTVSQLYRPTNGDREIAKFSDLQLCQAADSLQPSLNVNPASHPEYKENLRRSKALQGAIAARNINCYKLKATYVNPKPLSPRQKRERASIVCSNNAQRSQFADPSVILEMCAKGYQSTSEQCSRDITRFDGEAQKLSGTAKAEYVEIGNAFRIGCNQN